MHIVLVICTYCVKHPWRAPAAVGAGATPTAARALWRTRYIDRRPRGDHIGGDHVPAAAAHRLQLAAGRSRRGCCVPSARASSPATRPYRRPEAPARVRGRHERAQPLERDRIAGQLVEQRTGEVAHDASLIRPSAASGQVGAWSMNPQPASMSQRTRLTSQVQLVVRCAVRIIRRAIAGRTLAVIRGRSRRTPVPVAVRVEERAERIPAVVVAAVEDALVLEPVDHAADRAVLRSTANRAAEIGERPRRVPRCQPPWHRGTLAPFAQLGVEPVANRCPMLGLVRLRFVEQDPAGRVDAERDPPRGRLRRGPALPARQLAPRALLGVVVVARQREPELDRRADRGAAAVLVAAFPAWCRMSAAIPMRCANRATGRNAASVSCCRSRRGRGRESAASRASAPMADVGPRAPRSRRSRCAGRSRWPRRRPASRVARRARGRGDGSRPARSRRRCTTRARGRSRSPRPWHRRRSRRQARARACSCPGPRGRRPS